ncbi:glycoside hydrolase family 9 protein [Maricaulis sp. MIT060901]|uniref:glycoside hydrolase family 9 protein n=1 Tax=Maricaulis sp. MIT060901 TaxID=3096993 RepID=UPI00399B242F
MNWRVLDADGTPVASGTSEPFGYDESAGETVHHIDFAALSTPGTGFTIEACGARSRAFSIGALPYAELAEDSLRYFYLNRLGTHLDPAFTGGEAWARAGGFFGSQVTCFTGTDMTGTEWPGCDYHLDTTGGWADAGDYGQYVVNGGISVWTLQYVYERFQALGELAEFGWNGERVTLPESEDGVSEILLEARWQLEFMLAMQVPEGASVWVDAREDEAEQSRPILVDGSGLVHHKLHERSWLPLPLLPEDAAETRYLIPPTTAATLNLAASAAQCGRVWRELDPVFADQCLSAARRAFAAAERYPDLLARNTFDGGGAYGDLDVIDEFYWAAIELCLTTGEAAYRQSALTYREQLSGRRPIFWANTEMLPELSLLLSQDHPSLREQAKTIVRASANQYQQEMTSGGYHYPLTPSEITWGSSANLLNRALVMAAAHDVDPEQGFRDGVVHAMDYLLGRNPLDQSYIAGYGARPMRFPHHRFWANGADPEFPEAPPGALSGGPNHRIMIDPIAREMEGECAPQTCWADHVDAYALNEVAINWNAPLFAISVYLEATQANNN